MTAGPKHIGIILDGNRRFAKKKMLPVLKGHEKGADKFEEFLDWCEELNIEEITAYAFSMQNFKRTEEEKNFLIELFKKTIKNLLKEENLKKSQEKDLKIRFIGVKKLFSLELQKLMQELEEKTKNHHTKKLNLAMAYGGREEITEAVKKIAEKVQKGELNPAEITEEKINENLWLKSEPDLIIRTSGEKRTSNFLPWQSVYSEWFFIEKNWPEIEKEDLTAIIEEFKKRERRFGK